MAEKDAFPTDIYIIEGFIDLIQKGYQVELIDGVEDLSRALEKDVAVVVLSHVNYRTGYFMIWHLLMNKFILKVLW